MKDTERNGRIYNDAKLNTENFQNERSKTNEASQYSQHSFSPDCCTAVPPHTAGEMTDLEIYQRTFTVFCDSVKVIYWYIRKALKLDHHMREIHNNIYLEVLEDPVPHLHNKR